jgi:hypothetical protein
MDATIFCLSLEVREAALDVKALRRKVEQSGTRGYEWIPAEANARQRMISLSLEQGEDRRRTTGAPRAVPGPGKGFLKLA